MILRYRSLLTNQGKLLTKFNPKYVWVFKSLPWLVNRNLYLKIIKYLSIFLSQYCVQKYLVCISPYEDFRFYLCFMLFNWKYQRLTRKNKFKLYLFVFLFLRSHFETRKSKNKTLSLICLRGFGKFLSVEAIIRLSVEDILRCEMSTCQDNISVKQL